MTRRPVVAVAGLGLIGGSLALALTRAGFQVLGLDRPGVLRRARRLGAIRAACASLEAAAAGADVLVLAAPPRANRSLLRELSRLAASRLIVTDAGSVKGPIVEAAAALGLRRFVGGHPMTGSEGSGLKAARADLFDGRPWILTPGTSADARALRAVRALVRAAGARPVVLDAAEHDRVVAFLSHVPQLAAWALHHAARGDRVAGRRLGLAGPGFRDMTRLAKSPPGLWGEILEENAAEVRRALRAFGRALRPPR